jgi:hypothetical protein
MPLDVKGHHCGMAVIATTPANEIDQGEMQWASEVKMTTKERLACGERILRRIDARRRSTKDPKDLLPLEQAIVDRELLELDADPMTNVKAFLKPDRRRAIRRAVRRPPPET